MTNALKFISIVAVVLITLAYFLWVNYNDVKNLVPKKKKEILVYCTEYESKNLRLQFFVNEINSFKIGNRKEKKLMCDSKEIINVDFGKSNPPEAWKVWGFYKEVITHNLNNSSLPLFLNEFYRDSLQIQDREKIQNEIKSWLNEPQMTNDVRSMIKKSFE